MYEATSEYWVEFFSDFIKQIIEFTSDNIIDTLTPKYAITTNVSNKYNVCILTLFHVQCNNERLWISIKLIENLMN